MIGDLLQRAQVAALEGIGQRVYDTPPKDREFPYFQVGDQQDADDSSACGAAWEVTTDVHVWSRPVTGSRSELKSIAALAAGPLATLSLTGFRIVVQHLESARYFDDPDGLTKHGVLTFRYLIDPA